MRKKPNQVKRIVMALLISSLVATPLMAKKASGGGGGAAAAVEHAKKAVELLQQKQFEAAANEFTQAIAADPKDARMYANRAVALRAIPGRLPEALADCSKAV